MPGQRSEPDHDLLTVADRAGHVQPDGVGAVHRTTGGLQRIGDPSARSQGDQPRGVHQADHADHHRSVRTAGWAGPGTADDLGLGPEVPETRSTGGSLADITGGGPIAQHGEHRDQHRENRHDRRRDGTGAARIGTYPGRASLHAGTRREATAAATSSGRLLSLHRLRRPAGARSSASSGSVSGSAPSRRCSRSAGSSDRMRRR